MPSASHSPSADAKAGSATTRSGSARKRPRLSGFAPSTMRHASQRQTRRCCSTSTPWPCPSPTGAPQSSHCSGGGSAGATRSFGNGRCTSVGSSRTDRSGATTLDLLEVGHRGEERRDHLVATGCAAASGRPRGVGDADARHAVAELQERTAGRAAAAHVEEGVSQRTIDASSGCRPGAGRGGARTSPTNGSDATRSTAGVTAGFAELLHQDRERGGVELDRGGQQRLAGGSCFR